MLRTNNVFNHLHNKPGAPQHRFLLPEICIL